MKRVGVISFLALACGLVLAAGLLLVAAAPGGPGTLASLIRIPKSPSSPIAVLTRLQIDVRQELATCLLAFADREDLALLRRNRVPFTVFERNAARREFLVVGTGGPADLASLRAVGHAVAVEPRTAVFWRDEGNAAESVPAGLPRKALPLRSVLPYLRTRPVGDSPAAATSAQDPFVETIVSLVSSSNLAANVQTLQDFQTRYASTTNCESAGESLFASFTALGLDDVHFDPFTFSSTYTSRNVVAEKTGETYPDDIYIICSHYDSTSPSRLTLAPGADDNGSGTAAVLEAARVLAPYPLDFTVRFVAFSAEEWGLWGSRAYATAARAAGDHILGVINLDMIAYADALPEDLQIIVDQDSTWLADLFLQAGSHYGVVGGTKTVDASFVYSDHAPFWDNGYPAMLAIEDEPLTNPYYHRTTDTLDKLNLDFFTSATRTSVGLLAELAQPIKAGYPQTPVGVVASWVVYRSLFNALPAIHLAWTAQSDAAGYNVYRAPTAHGEFLKAPGSPVIGTEYTDTAVILGTTYYYVITAVGPTGLESNRSRETIPVERSIIASSSDRTISPLMLRGLR